MTPPAVWLLTTTVTILAACLLVRALRHARRDQEGRSESRSGAEARTRRNVLPHVTHVELVIGDPTAPALRVMHLADLPPGPTELVHEGLHAPLARLLQAMPGFLRRRTSLAGARTIEVAFSPAGQAGVRRGELIQDKMLPMLRNRSSGQISELARTQGVQLATVAAAAWQIAAVITAQKFLADIDAKLGAIAERLERVELLLLDGQRSRVAGGLRYLRAVADHLSHGELTPVEAQTFDVKLEDIELTCHEAMDGGVRSLRRIIGAQDQVATTAYFSSEAKADEMRKTIDGFRDQLEVVQLACALRLAAAQMKLALPVSAELARRRIDHVGADLRDVVQLVAEFNAVTKKKAKGVKAKFRRRIVDVRHRTAVRRYLTSRTRVLTARNNELEVQRARLLEAAVLPLETERLFVTIDSSGKLLDARRLLPSAKRTQP